MFTGIIEETGIIKRINKSGVSGSLVIEGKKVLQNTKVGDSIAVNGVCLTATSISGNTFTADVMAETFRRSNLGSLSPGSYVNLERAMAADGRFGGHIVSGHIDGTGEIADMSSEGNAVWVTVVCTEGLLKYIIEKGSITIDGISLTVAFVDNRSFKVSVIPHTGSETTLLKKKPGDIVNLENDIIGKYVEKLMTFSDIGLAKNNKPSIDLNFLADNGFM